MYLIETRNRQTIRKHLGKPRMKFYPSIYIDDPSRYTPSPTGGTFLGDDTLIMGLKLAGITHSYIGPFDDTLVTELEALLEGLDTALAFAKNDGGAIDKLIDDYSDAQDRRVSSMKITRFVWRGGHVRDLIVPKCPAEDSSVVKYCMRLKSLIY